MEVDAQGRWVAAEEGEEVEGVVGEGGVEGVSDSDVHYGLHPLLPQEAPRLDEGARLGEEAVLDRGVFVFCVFGVWLMSART